MNEDQGTTAAVGASFGLALVAGPVLALSRRGRLPVRWGWIGVGMMTGGLALRIAAARALGSHYTRTLRTVSDQPVVLSGPYRYVRHPGYAGVLAMWLGYGLALTSLRPRSSPPFPTRSHIYSGSMPRRPCSLIRLLTSYRSYRRHTKRLVPGLY